MQVARKEDVYKKAYEVIAWLDASSEYSNDALERLPMLASLLPSIPSRVSHDLLPIHHLPVENHPLRQLTVNFLGVRSSPVFGASKRIFLTVRSL